MKKCILLVEDNDPMRENTAELLELSNYEVIVARDGKQGLKMFLARNPDLILCDIMMPGMNGYEILRTLREDYRIFSTPFIFLTAYSEKKDIEKGLQMGATDYMIKPFDGDDLINLIHKHLPEQVSNEL
jgi:CRP/FNR family transcriptional regulator, cyclic AMP receptor protein